MSKKPERIGKLYKKDNHMNSLTIRAQKLDKLNTIFQNSLPLKFVNHCNLANISDDSIIVITDNASYASLLRFQSRLLCKNISAHLPKPVTKLKVKVRPKTYRDEIGPYTPPKRLSSDSADIVESTAAEMKDGPLKAALQKLASRRSGKP
ncbi:MAG TPA: DUF721 domain-containing protein [Methylophaga aminisulfidivorans]|uniref:DUF721 domain-containing protein n=1 Tax=Methylophaga aminisulfidivorans TaxID=230105 RepID=A0A7C2AQB1_9GAMM|nr:DUF721 domain-containing protein [Methylophaga aminisulfidivorans]